MEWVKLTTDYFRDLAIALGDDALEVMFTRGLALAGEIEQAWQQFVELPRYFFGFV